MLKQINEDEIGECIGGNTSNIKLEPSEEVKEQKLPKKVSTFDSLGKEKEKTKVIKNDTKNIPKNFGTAICIYIKKNPNLVKKLLQDRRISYTSFLNFNKTIKHKLNSLIDLRKIWSSSPEDPQHETKRCFRILSFKFMRKHCLHYIFDSRIKNLGSHIRYRKKVLDGMEKPAQLTNLKDY